eukprot:8991937-Lingulodinium_polyedra.AAC.1
MLDTMRGTAHGVEHGGMMFAVCGAVWFARAGLKPFLNSFSAFPAQKWLQTRSSMPHSVTHSKLSYVV